MALLHAKRARIALLAPDRPAFEQHSALAAQTSEELRHRGLAVSLQQLIRDAERADQPVSLALARGAEPAATAVSEVSVVDSSVVTMLGTYRGAKQRAEHALELLIGEAQARGGYLLGITPEGQLETLAWRGVETPDAALEGIARDLLDAARTGDDLETQIEDGAHDERSTLDLSPALVHGLQPFLLRGSRSGRDAPVAVVLLRSPDMGLLRLPATLLGAICDGLVRAGDLAAS